MNRGGCTQLLARRRAASWAALWLAGAACLAGCAMPSRGGVAPQRPNAPPYAGTSADASVRAARARAAADSAQADGAASMFDSLQLRVRGLGRDGLSQGDGVIVGARLNTERPFRTSALATSLRHRSDASAWLAHAALAEAEGLRCEAAVSARAQSAREAENALFRARAQNALAWADALKGAGEVDAVLALATELSARRALVSRAPRTVLLTPAEGEGILPDVLADRAAPLDLAEAHVKSRIASQHPRVMAHAATAERYRAESLAERRARMPWLDFVQLDYTTGRATNNAFAARFAVGVPLDDGSRGRANRAALLAESEGFEADSAAQLLLEAARAALAELSDVEARVADYRALLAVADAAELLALRLLAERRGLPDKALQLLDDAADARGLVLSAREQAGLAACTLALSTGARYADWPRLAH